MQQPELGLRLVALRKEKNLTQEELVEMSHVSVRTIQRIESGEVLPRMSTVKILFEALGASYESITSKSDQVMETEKSNLPNANRSVLLVAVLAGAVYLVSQIILGAMDFAWFVDEGDWGFWMNATYTGLTIVMVLSNALFARGFMALSTVFENSLLKLAAWMLIIVTFGWGILNVSTLSADVESLWLPYSVAAIILGVSSIIFGVSLIRLQDGMGELSRVAGILEIVMGCMLITVVLFSSPT